MSAENVKWRVNMAVRRSNLPPAARLIMLVLSDMADAKTGVIPERQSPSLADLARDTGHGESTVKAQLLILERLGWVVRSRPDKRAQGRYASTGYRLQVGDGGEERTPHKRARSKPSQTAEEGQEMANSEGQEQALLDEQEGQEIAPRGPGDSSKRARSRPPYLKDDDLDDPDDPFAADAAAAIPKQRRKSKAPKPEPDPEVQARATKAREIVTWWWEQLAIKPSGKNAFIASTLIVDGLLAVGHEPKAVAAAAREIGSPITIARMEIQLGKTTRASPLNGRTTHVPYQGHGNAGPEIYEGEL